MPHPPSLWKNALALAAGLLCTAQAAAQCAGVRELDHRGRAGMESGEPG